MRKIQFTLLILTIIMSTCLMAEERTFYLRSGDKITGEVMRIDDAGIYTVKTSFGLVTFHKDDIKPEDVEIFMKNGDKVQGVIIEESDQLFKLRTGFGEVSVDKKNIDKVDFKSREVSTPGVSKKDDGRWYYAEEQLVDIWFDPVGFTLAENELYLSGFSWAYGLTNRFQLSSKWYSYFYGDLNLRPKYMVFKRGDVERTHALSVGGHFHLRALPSKYKFRTWQEGLDTNSEWVRVGAVAEINEEGVVTDYNDNPAKGEDSWYEIFGAYTISTLRNSGQGRLNYNFGTSLTFYPDEDVMPRAYFAIDADARRNLKLMFELFYDPYHVPWINWMEDEDTSNDIFLDFGFVYSYNKKLRIGIHFQKPFIAFYYKF